MKELLDWFNQSVSEETYHPLTYDWDFYRRIPRDPSLQRRQRPAVAHPSTTLLLLRAGYGYVPSSMEGVIEANKEKYYLALSRTQQTIRKEKQTGNIGHVFS